jgi:2-polyprenyl-3-methyl-5-hydroxy-6-metoxy-1,4-benzoquinol methylase
VKHEGLGRFFQRMLGDLSANWCCAMVSVGHKLGLYGALAGAGAATVGELAALTDTDERCVREWLHGQRACGYIAYDPATQAFSLPPEHAAVLADPQSPFFMPPAFDVVGSVWNDEDKILDAFRTGRGFGWHQHDPRLFSGTEAFFRNGYRANLATAWIPALEGVEPTLQRGGTVADVGCGHGASTIIMAEAFPASRFIGYDLHGPSIEVARRRAAEAGLADRVRFEVASALAYPGQEYDLVCFMDAFHDLGDPVGAARHARGAIRPEGTLMLVEPFAGEDGAANQGPVAAMFYAASAAICTPNAVAQGAATALGAQAGPVQLARALTDAGFGRVRVAASTPFNLVMEARP